MNTFKLTVYAADKPLFDGECISLVIPTISGQYGVQANHSNTIAAVVPGMLKFTTPDNKETVAAVSDGLMKVENNSVLLLVDTAERPEEIDINRAKRSAEEAKEAILQKKSIHDYYTAQAKMARAISRLRVKNHYNI